MVDKTVKIIDSEYDGSLFSLGKVAFANKSSTYSLYDVLTGLEMNTLHPKNIHDNQDVIKGSKELIYANKLIVLPYPVSMVDGHHIHTCHYLITDEKIITGDIFIYQITLCPFVVNVDGDEIKRVLIRGKLKFEH